MDLFPFTGWILPVVLLLVKSSQTRVIDTGNGTEMDVIAVRPVLSSDKLHEIRLYDRMKCFPKVLCTLTKSGAFAKLGSVSLNDLADGYLRLLTAFPGGPPSDLTSQDEAVLSFKDDFNFPSSYFNEEEEEEEEEEPYITKHRHDEEEEEEYKPKHGYEEEEEDQEESTKNKNRKDKESEEQLLSDPLLHQKERLKMKKLMDELLAEEKAEALHQPESWTKTAITLPLKIGGTLLSKVVLPYLVGGLRRRRSLRFHRDGKTFTDPMEGAMKRWSRLKSPQQCGKLYPTCPFEAWEVVSMIKLIKDGTRKSN